MGVPDIVLLYRTLVADGGLPSGYKKELSSLGPILESAAQCQDRKIRDLSNVEASVFLKQREERSAKDAKTSADQFLLASKVYVTSATQPLCGTDSPKGCRRKEKGPLGGSVGSHAGSHTYVHGKIARGQAWYPPAPRGWPAGSTLRSRVRAVRRYLNWLALNHDTGYPREFEHVTGYLQGRQSEP